MKYSRQMLELYALHFLVILQSYIYRIGWNRKTIFYYNENCWFGIDLLLYTNEVLTRYLLYKLILDLYSLCQIIDNIVVNCQLNSAVWPSTIICLVIHIDDNHTGWSWHQMIRWRKCEVSSLVISYHHQSQVYIVT